MHASSSDSNETAHLAKRLASWLEGAGVAQPDLAVDFADLVSAAKDVDAVVRSLLALDLKHAENVEQAAELVGQLRATLFTEMKGHLEELERSWSKIEDPIFERLSSE